MHSLIVFNGDLVVDFASHKTANTIMDEHTLLVADAPIQINSKGRRTSHNCIHQLAVQMKFAKYEFCLTRQSFHDQVCFKYASEIPPMRVQ